MANEPDDNPPSLRETAGTRIEMPSIPLQDNVLLKMLTILQKMDENQQKAEKDRGERENKILGQILVTQDQIVVTQNAMLEMMKAIHITEETGERWREESSETKSEEDNDKTAFIPPVVQDSTVSTTGHKISGKTVMVGRRNTNIVNNNFSCKMIVCVLKNSDQSNNMDQSNSLERDLRRAICNQNNEVVQELEQMLEATLDEVRVGSIVLVFLTANRNRFRKLFFQHEEKIKHLMENSVKGLLRGTKDSEANYSIDIKIEDDNQDTGKDKSSTGISSTRKDNLHNDEKHSEGEDEDDDDDDDDDDENKGATSANTYISRISDEKRHKSGIRPEVLGKNK